MATKKLQEQFNKKVDTLLCDFKAQKQENGRREYILSTKAGDVRISVHEPEKTSVFSVYCKFENVQEAKPLMEKFENFNPYSGKWNFHYMDGEYLLKVFENDLLNILN